VTLSKRERRLLALLALIAGTAGLRLLWFAAATPAGLGEGGFAGGGRSGRGGGVPDAVVTLRTDLLDPAPQPFRVGRDLFRYGPPPPPPGPTPEELEARRREAEERRRQAELAAASPREPQPPPIPFTYLGSFGRDEAKIAVLVDKSTQEVVNARAGDVVAGQFIVERIGYESIDVRFVGFPDAPAKRLAIEG